MKNIMLNRLMRIIRPLSPESKLELISKISESLKFDLKRKKAQKETILEELYGSWKDQTR